MSYRASIIKSIQTGTLTLSSVQTTNTATITAVVVNNSVMQLSWTTQATNSSAAAVSLVLTNSTTLTATRTAHQSSTLDIQYTVIEFYGSVLRQAVQSFSISLGSGTSTNTATITSVTTTKAAILPTGYTQDTAAAFRPDYTFAYLTLTNATTVTATRQQTTGTTVVTGMVVEFK